MLDCFSLWDHEWSVFVLQPHLWQSPGTAPCLCLREWQVTITYSSVQSWLSNDTRSENRPRMDCPSLWLCYRLTTCLWNIPCVDTPCSWFLKFWRCLDHHHHKLFLQSPVPEGNRIFCPIQPPKPVTLRFSCPWAWSMLLVFETTPLPWPSHPSLIGWGKDFISRIWTGSHLL